MHAPSFPGHALWLAEDSPLSLGTGHLKTQLWASVSEAASMKFLILGRLAGHKLALASLVLLACLGLAWFALRAG